MKPLERLEQETQVIQDFMTESYDQTNGSVVSGRIADIGVYIASSASLVALSEMVYNEALARLTENYLDKKIGATEKKYIITGKLSKESYYMTLCERQNKALGHMNTSLITQLSYIKAEMQNIN